MKFFYQEHAKQSGIYKIINTYSNRIYIGQAKPFKQRWYGHKKSLSSNKHQNKFLQNDFNKCKEELGHDDFLEFHVVEVMENSTKEERNHKEEFFITSVFDKQENCYNFKQKVEAKEASCYSYTPEKTSQKLSEISKEMWANRSEEEKKEISDKISKATKGIKIHTEESKKKMSESHKNIEDHPGRFKTGECSDRSGENHPMFGKHHTEESRQKMKETHRGQESGFLGKNHSEESKEKNRKAHLGRIPWNKGKTDIYSEETKKKMGEMNKNRTPWNKSINLIKEEIQS